MLTIAVCLLLACAALSGFVGYSWRAGQLTDRQEIVVRGVAYVHTVPQRSIQQLESTVMSISEAPSLDDVDTVMANLEGLCSEETSWKSQETNLEQCIQGPWLKAEELQGAAVQGAGSSRPSSRSPTGSQQQQQPQPTPARGLLGLRSGSFRRAAKSTKAAARKLSEASECGAALGIPKVALLFLTPGDMPLEQTWEAWLRATHGKLRVDCLAKRVCDSTDEHATLAAINAACAPGNATLSHLFSIYIHPSPTHKGYPKGSIFHGRAISPRVKVEWASWGIVEAERLLLRAALEDPLNQRFVFLSEACAPLLPASVMYAQLMSEPKSRINACSSPDWDADTDRWEPEMEQGELSLKHWRKSAQWASLTRKHAQIVSDDVAIADIFAKHCRVGTDKKTGHVYKCIADEHYIPTLLALKGVEAETDCSGSMTYVHWWGEGATMKPETFVRDEVSGDLIEQMRMSDFGCENAAAIASAPNILTTMDDLASKRCEWQPKLGYSSGLLGPSCHLFARKWDKWTSEAMMDLLELEESLSMLDDRTGACLRPPQPLLLSDV
ncbi:g10215 [Coccomyxa elongata]